MSTHETSLAHFRDTLPDFFDLDDVSAASPPDTVVDAARSVLVAGFTQTPTAVDPGLVQLAAMVLGAVGGHGDRCFDAIVPSIAHVALLRQLAPLLRTVAGEELVPVLCRGLSSPAELVAARTVLLVRWCLHGPGAPALTHADAAALNGAVQALRATAQADGPLDAELGRWIPARATA